MIRVSAREARKLGLTEKRPKVKPDPKPGVGFNGFCDNCGLTEESDTEHICERGPWTILIPGYLPPSLNALMHCHWRTKHKLKKECVKLLSAYAAKVPRIRAKMRARITLTRSGKRTVATDPDNAKKCLLDALKQCHLIVDDSAAWLECPDPVQVRGAKNETRIELEVVT